jgi:hypothetical protein
LRAGDQEIALMQVQKFRGSADGLVPAGAYFAQLTAKLEDMNAREAALRDERDEEDRALEEIYRRRSGARMKGVEREQQTMM